ncbi:hypothetical protein E2C01_077940 [Portunus trituberculatus]|uniref:Uncharacterized protein n=1 Tax=Portunus trituberculatus TaxID=210409 RepID=A0A5B7INK2_PORTR|nr:hypothetical protein [Portunus trituberculatus]
MPLSFIKDVSSLPCAGNLPRNVVHEPCGSDISSQQCRATEVATGTIINGNMYTTYTQAPVQC